MDDWDVDGDLLSNITPMSSQDSGSLSLDMLEDTELPDFAPSSGQLTELSPPRVSRKRSQRPMTPDKEDSFFLRSNLDSISPLRQSAKRFKGNYQESPGLNRSHNPFLTGNDKPFGVDDLRFPSLNHNINALPHYKRTFEELKRLGSGSFGSVYLCEHRTDGIKYAVKKIPLPPNVKKANEIKREAQALATIVNEHVVLYRHSWEQREDDDRKYLYIQMEYCGGGTLLDLINSGHTFDAPEIISILRSTLTGLAAIHKSMAHLDIKPANIFLTPKAEVIDLTSDNDDDDEMDDDDDDEEKVLYKIGDFGLASLATPGTRKTQEGDARYLAREMMDDFINTGLQKADIFSLGLSAYALLMGQEPPESLWQTLRPIPGEEPPLNELPGFRPLDSVTEKLVEAILEMIHPDPEKRPSARKLLKKDLFLSKKQRLAKLARFTGKALKEARMSLKVIGRGFQLRKTQTLC
eukprot:TRINITY_DN398_c0_g4_i1.p1 TRINITY_DN398_c0_g4~~TRINITY_DN398_c0_g4_i1.p1  ORF type:complete len:465 (+),score=117.34 TRINITY_DN398_c0_g4_i1:111-1505(+)